MRTPSKLHLAAKAFFRDLLDACGGPKRASTITEHPDSHLSAMGAAHVHDRWPRLDHVIDLEQECGQPFVTRFMADALGYDLVQRQRSAHGKPMEVFARLVKETSDVQVCMVEAMADGRLNSVERAEIIKEAQQAIGELENFINALRGNEG